MLPNTYRLRLPGPTAVPERVRRVLADPALNHRGPEFRAILREAGRLAQGLFQTTNDVLFFAGSGTGVMEASIANLVAPGDRVLVNINGQFGERFAAIARTWGADVEILEVPWGKPVDPDAVARQLSLKEYRAVLVTHNESSTGVASDLAAIGQAVKDSSAVLVVDAVSSLGAIPVRQDDWHLDVVLSASQKALMCQPGVGLVSISPKAWEVVNRETGTPRFFWDFRKGRASQEKDETPFTPPVALVAGLRESLRMIHEEGPVQVLVRHHRLASALRTGIQAMGLSLFADSSALSDSVTAIRMPEGLDGGAVVRHLYERYRTVIGGSRNRLSGKVIRIGTMGYVDASDILTDLLHLEQALCDLGHPVPAGAGVQAAAAALYEQAD